MSMQQASAAATEQDRLQAELPGWTIWPIRAWGVGNVWSAMPDGATVAVFTGLHSGDDLVKAVREYQRDVERHLDDARALLASCDSSGIGRDRAAVVGALVAALEAMAVRLAAG
jgi:hypothetical protein